MKLALKNPAPDDDSQQRWGDFHFGNAFQHALERKGVRVFQDFWPNWAKDHGEDAILVLRGLHQFQPPKEKFNVLWIISHPAMVGPEELDGYDLIFTASALHCSLLRELTARPVEVARQCTEFGDFSPFASPLSEEAGMRKGIVYVANSRGKRREMAQWIEETNTRVRVFGRAWEKFAIGDLVEREYVPNSDLPDLYRSARLCLNDHWQDMRAFGFISNRVFDSLACGLPVLTDAFPEIREYFGDALLFARNAEEFRERLAFCEANYEEVLGRTREVWNRIGGLHTFAARAGELIDWIRTPPPGNVETRPLMAGSSQGQQVYSVLRESVEQEEQKTEYLERQVAKQTRKADQARKESAWAKERREEERKRRIAEEQAKYELQRELKKEKEKSTALVRYAERLRNQLQEVYESRSWKIAAPYRMLARAVQGRAKGKKVGRARIPDWPDSLAESHGRHENSRSGEAKRSSSAKFSRKLQTEYFQNPVFADQLFVPANTAPKNQARYRQKQMRMLWSAKRRLDCGKSQARRLFSGVRRRFGHGAGKGLKKAFSFVWAGKAGNSAGQNADKMSGMVPADASPHGLAAGQEEPSADAAREIAKEIDFWYERAIQLLKDLETVRGHTAENCGNQQNTDSRKQAARHIDNAISGNEALRECNAGPGLESRLQYWRMQVLHLYEELEYAKAHAKDPQADREA